MEVIAEASFQGLESRKGAYVEGLGGLWNTTGLTYHSYYRCETPHTLPGFLLASSFAHEAAKAHLEVKGHRAPPGTP